MPISERPSWKRARPGTTLMVLAPVIAEVLPGATRISSIFVLPIEVFVWGGGALMIRDVVRRRGLGWPHMLLLSLALAVAEETLIQQTSLAPMVLQLKGEVYARSFGVNYVYLLWALVYETVFVVMVPVHLCEMLFADRKDEPWLRGRAAILLPLLFMLGACLAWYSWTQMARPLVFRVPPYNPPLPHVLIALGSILLLVALALGPMRHRLSSPAHLTNPPPPLWLGVGAGLAAVLWYALVLLGFGIAPQVPPGVAVASGLALAAGTLAILPRWAGHERWGAMHQYSTIVGAILGSMLVGFVGFIGATALDLYGKLALNLLAVVLLFILGRRLNGVGMSFRSPGQPRPE